MSEDQAPIEVRIADFTGTHMLKGGCRVCGKYGAVVVTRDGATMMALRETKCMSCGQVYILIDAEQVRRDEKGTLSPELPHGM